jgi:hypothetical protein
VGEDREALEVIRTALRGPTGGTIVAHFYTCWFAIDPTVRDLFPASMHDQRAIFLEVLDWVIGEFVAHARTRRWSS